MNNFGNYLKKLREEKSLSIRKASEKIGISHTYLDSLEKGFDPRTKKERKPTPEVLKKIADGLEHSYEYLMYLSGYTNHNPARQTGKHIKIRREEKNISIEELGEKSKMDIKFLKAIENGEVLPNKSEIEKIMHAIFDNEVAALASYDVLIRFAGYESFDSHEDILNEVRTLLNTNKGKWHEATPEEINVMIEDHQKFLEGKLFDIEDLLLLDEYYIKYKGKVLMPEEKKKILDLINITFN